MLSLTNTTLGSGVSPLGTDVLRRLLQAVTLQPQPAAQSRIDCAVVRLPLKNGVATVDRSIALETDSWRCRPRARCASTTRRWRWPSGRRRRRG